MIQWSTWWKAFLYVKNKWMLTDCKISMSLYIKYFHGCIHSSVSDLAVQKGYFPFSVCLFLLVCCYRPVGSAGKHKEQWELSETSSSFLDNLCTILVSLGGWEGAGEWVRLCLVSGVILFILSILSKHVI